VTGWSVELTPRAKRSLADLPEKAAVSVVEFVFGPLSDDPLRLSKPLRFEFDGLRTARRGAYRVTFEADAGTRRIRIELVQHRSTAYRRGWHA
jgi:mRNA-degrading endonuclease RelE of RelBE toxin-antitoxin system